MTIATATVGTTYKVHSVNGDEKTKKFLSTLGLLHGLDITLISKSGTNFILNIKDSRYAIDKALASQINIDANSGVN